MGMLNIERDVILQNKVYNMSEFNKKLARSDTEYAYMEKMDRDYSLWHVDCIMHKKEESPEFLWVTDNNLQKSGNNSKKKWNKRIIAQPHCAKVKINVTSSIRARASDTSSQDYF